MPTKKELAEVLLKMVGWLKYCEDCDHWYLSEEQAPGYHADLSEAKLAIATVLKHSPEKLSLK